MNGYPAVMFIAPRKSSGFTLVEMAMVLMIIGLLLGGLVPTISAQMETQRIGETRRQMSEIKNALTGFAIINGVFPCPADGTIATGESGAGIKVSDCSSGASGVLPWATLGVSETDAWGRRFTYRVTPAFANDAVHFNLSSSPNLDVGLTTSLTDKSVAGDVPVVIVSHGSNGLGAYNSAGGAPPTSATGDELDNVATNNNNHFTSHDFMQNGFDDIVVWVSSNTLINRMVAAGKLP